MSESPEQQFEYEERWHKAGLNDMKRLGPTSRHVRKLIKKLAAPLDFRTVLDVGC